MTRFIRSLRGDLRVAARPACLLVLVGVALLAGLFSAVMQDASYQQLETAREAVRDQVWTATPCTGSPGCRRARQQERRAVEGFLSEQQRIAARVGALQVPSGVLRFAAAFMGLGTGVVGIALLATFTLAGEWTRNTIGLALAGGVTARGLAMRRFIALCLLGLVALAAAAIGAALAAAWGQSARPLSAGDPASLGKPLVGGVVLLIMATLAGVAVAAAGAAALAGFLVGGRSEQLAALLEPRALRRWVLRYLAVLLFIAMAILAATAVTFAAATVQALRIDRPLALELGGAGQVHRVFLRALLPMASFAAVGVFLASVLRGNPAVAVVTAAGGVLAMLLLQHLMGARGDIVLPTAWVGRWLDLPAGDFGVAYFWTAGSFGRGQLAAGVAVAIFALVTAAAGWAVIARAARA